MAWEWVAPVATAGVSVAAVVSNYRITRRTIDGQAQLADANHHRALELAQLAHDNELLKHEREQRVAAYVECLTAIRGAGTTWQQLTDDARNQVRIALVRVELLGSPVVTRKAEVVLDLVSHETITSPVSLGWIEEQLLDAMREELTGHAGLALERAEGRVRRDRMRAGSDDEGTVSS